MKSSKVIRAMSLCVVSGAIGGAAFALPLPPGGQIALPGTTVAAEAWLAGTSAAAAIDIPFTVLDAGGSPVFQGTLVSSAARSNDMGTLRFDYRVLGGQAVGDRRVARVDIAGYTGFQTNVNHRTDSSGDVGASAVSRPQNGSQVSFFFNTPPLESDQDSWIFFVHTDAPSYSEEGQVRIVLNTGEFVIFNGGVRIPKRFDCPGDTNGDNLVNFSDLNTVLSNFGDNCN